MNSENRMYMHMQHYICTKGQIQAVSPNTCTYNKDNFMSIPASHLSPQNTRYVHVHQWCQKQFRNGPVEEGYIFKFFDVHEFAVANALYHKFQQP